ncbi:hypothetical protein VTL71DRAFT_7135 [Oculimacula yallundae]|uniref:Uncharacterized protein n=1 Tax=Oculimacula yallundae TaxID=86028 RepID=A0ABR4BWN6_9HELO
MLRQNSTPYSLIYAGALARAKLWGSFYFPTVLELYGGFLVKIWVLSYHRSSHGLRRGILTSPGRCNDLDGEEQCARGPGFSLASSGSHKQRLPKAILSTDWCLSSANPHFNNCPISALRAVKDILLSDVATFQRKEASIACSHALSCGIDQPFDLTTSQETRGHHHA